MIKDDKDTTYNRLQYYPHYWIKQESWSYVLYRTTNAHDKLMVREDGSVVSSDSYTEIYELARKLNARNTEEFRP